MERLSKDLVLPARAKDLGGFFVHRALPTAQKRHLGPFVFLDHMGPFKMDRNHPLDVRPHPHIGLATVTYLFEGRGFHRDSLGSKQEINPGDLNWMTAGKGIVHSERTPEDLLLDGVETQMHGVQIWVALPQKDEDCEPQFHHWPKEKLPEFRISSNLNAKLMLGDFQKFSSPVKTLSPTLFMDIYANKDVSESISFQEQELGVFVVSGEAAVNNQVLKSNDLIAISNPKEVTLKMSENSRVIVIGGLPFPEPRYMWWNFVSSKVDKIKSAAENWKNQKMGRVVDEVEYIPLPDIPFPKEEKN